MTEHSMSNAARNLADQLSRAELELDERQTAQGGIGNFVDLLKNNFGGSTKNLAATDPKALWAHVLNSEHGSTAIRAEVNTSRQQINQLNQAARRRDEVAFNRIYTELTGTAYEKNGRVAELKVSQSVKQFDASQKGGVDAVADFGALACALASTKVGVGPRFVSSAVAGGFGKAMIKDMDGAYSSPAADTITGGLGGLSLPAGEVLGAALTRTLSTRIGMTPLLSEATNSGVQGSLFGSIDSATRSTIEQIQANRGFSLETTIDAAGRGGVWGFGGGAVLGAAAHKLSSRSVRENTNHPNATKSGATESDDVLPSIEEQWQADRRRRHEFVEGILSKRFANERDLNVLEIGAAGQPGFPEALKPNMKRFVDVDISENGLQRQRERLFDLDSFWETHASHVQGDARNLPFGDGSFDLVVSHWVDPLMAERGMSQHFVPSITEAARVLKPGGKMVLNPWELTFTNQRTLTKLFDVLETIPDPEVPNRMVLILQKK